MSVPWQAFVQVRLGYYEDMISDPELLRENQWSHNRDLFQVARETGCRTALATMSGRQRTRQVLEALRLTRASDFVATRGDVDRGKPNPEIYYLVCRELGIPSIQSLAIEDSPAGVEAALAADLHCIAVTTPFTREKIRDQGLPEPRWIVDDSDRLPTLARELIETSNDS